MSTQAVEESPKVALFPVSSQAVARQWPEISLTSFQVPTMACGDFHGGFEC